jgi:glycosyltransferase involved in cell wall biosynthesis
MALIHFISNGVFTTSIAGGDIHFLKLAEGAVQAGHTLNFFGGHALKEVIEQHGVPGAMTLTDAVVMPRVNTGALRGQLSMFRDFVGRYQRTVRLLDRIGESHFAYAVSDYWFDVLPVVRSAARRKLMVLHMEAPRLAQVAARSRPDVDPKRLASLHYWASQEWSLRSFCETRVKHLFYLHPLMEPRLRKLGVSPRESTLLSYGLDVAATDAVAAQPRVFDVVWIGRVHRQKGIDDLLDTLVHLRAELPDLRAVFIGNVRDALAAEVQRRGLERVIEFPGFVSEAEKIRLFKSSRVFLMPSRHEGSPRVIGESIIAGTPVVAYELENYRPLYGGFARYAPSFDLKRFQELARREILAMRSGTNYLDGMDLAAFKHQNSWETTQERFLAGLRSMV